MSFLSSLSFKNLGLALLVDILISLFLGLLIAIVLMFADPTVFESYSQDMPVWAYVVYTIFGAGISVLVVGLYLFPRVKGQEKAHAHAYAAMLVLLSVLLSFTSQTDLEFTFDVIYIVVSPLSVLLAYLIFAPKQKN